MEFAKGINKWANAKEEESKRDNSGSNELQREFASDEVKECVAKLKHRKAAGADEIVNEFVKYEWIRLDMEKRVHTQQKE